MESSRSYIARPAASNRGRSARSRSSARPRNALLTLVFVLVAVLTLLIFVVPQRPATALDSLAVEAYLVASGDTLWDIASQHPVAGLSTQEGVHWLMEQNGLSSALLRPGQVIVVAS